MKSNTDKHWNSRALTEVAPVHANITDIHQRELEFDAICPHLDHSMRVLEVGCGNGFSTDRFRQHSKFVDAFDFAENMIDQAREHFGESNNRFFHDNVLEPQHLNGPYDTVVCVRVLINLANLEQQLLGIENMIRSLRPGGKLILVEGFREGFEALSQLRQAVGLDPLTPAPINVYPRRGEILPAIQRHCTEIAAFHLGAYDYLTRVVYPLTAGPEGIQYNSPFAAQSMKLARAFNADCFDPYARVRGYVFTRHGE